MPQIESTVKASMLDLKNSFSACHKVLLFSLSQIGVCLPFENGSAIGKRIIKVRYTKREHNYKGALFGFLLTALSIWDTTSTIFTILIFFSAPI